MKIFGFLPEKKKEDVKELMPESSPKSAAKGFNLDMQAFARRALLLVVAIDTSGSMDGEKIKNANMALRRAVKEVGALCEEQSVDLYFTAVKFDSKASFVTRMEKYDKNTYQWEDLTTGSTTNMAEAIETMCDLKASELEGAVKILSPVAVLISDGYSTSGSGEMADALKHLNRHPLFRKAIRVPIGIGSKGSDGVYSFDEPTLMAFGNQNLLLTAENPEEIVSSIIWTTMSASQMSVTPENATGQSLGETYKKSLGVMSGSIGGEVSIPKAITGNVPAKKQFV